MPTELELAERAARRHGLPADGVLVNVDLGLTREEAARALKVSTETLREWERLGKGPRVVRVSERKAYYPSDALCEWINARTTCGE